LIKPASRLIKEILKVMKENGYVGEFKEVEDGRGNYIKLALTGNINKCGVIKPRYSVKSKDFEKAEQILNRSLAIEDTAVARFNRAMIYKETNRTQEAIEDLKAALERNPGLNVAESALESLERQ